MFFGYNTNGFAHHRLDDIVAILTELGYQGIALTPDVQHLDPDSDSLVWERQLARLQRQLVQNNLSCVLETGARFLLDPRRKHQPTLISPQPAERNQRLTFLLRCVEMAEVLGADAVSLWSGTPTDAAPPSVLMQRLVDECKELADYAAARQVRLAFEPEPGMFIDTMPRFAELHARVNHPAFGLTLDIGHLHCQGEEPICAHLERWQPWLWNVHLDDMKRGIHDHLPFGEGEIDLPTVLATLRKTGYAHGAYVELSRHSHNAVETARQSLAYLRRVVG
jgi:sugar phosphate isomerase/epimerase